MFEGYNGRRRLKTAIALCLAFLIVLALFRRPKKQIQYVDDGLLIPPEEIQPAMPAAAAAAPVSEDARGVVAAIEFINSPYLFLESLPSNLLPVMVLSRASNIEVRDAIRRTWGFYRSYRSNTIPVKIFFLVGTDDFMTQRIIMEQNVFDDVIQVTVPDMYSFSAYKELSAMIWIRKYLPDLRYYIKTEDDVILNTKLLVEQVLPIVESVSDQQMIVGWFGSEHSVQRGTYQKFVDAVLPASAGKLNYAMSLLYAVTASSADSMIDSLRQVESIEYPGDPFVTGILRAAAHVQFMNFSTSLDGVKYDLANGACKTSFEKYPNLLLCTSSLHIGSIKSMPEYFEAWNVLIGENNS